MALGYDGHGWAVWSRRQLIPDTSLSFGSLSEFDEAQRLLVEHHDDQLQFGFLYTSRGMLYSVDFTDVVGGVPQDPRPLIRETEYDEQGRRVTVVYGDQFQTS